MDLYDAITQQKRGGFPHPIVKEVFIQLLDALEHCHSLGIYHRDIKPENALISHDYRIKLADFGLATYDAWSGEFGCGSLRYLSPEAIGPKHNRYSLDGYSTAANDVWSLGVILINLLFGRNPWHEATATDPIYSVYTTTNPHILMDQFKISAEFNSLLARVFKEDPMRRISLAELREGIIQLRAFMESEIVMTEAAAVATVPSTTSSNSSSKTSTSSSISTAATTTTTRARNIHVTGVFSASSAHHSRSRTTRRTTTTTTTSNKISAPATPVSPCAAGPPSSALPGAIMPSGPLQVPNSSTSSSSTHKRNISNKPNAECNHTAIGGNDGICCCVAATTTTSSSSSSQVSSLGCGSCHILSPVTPASRLFSIPASPIVSTGRLARMLEDEHEVVEEVDEEEHHNHQQQPLSAVSNPEATRTATFSEFMRSLSKTAQNKNADAGGGGGGDGDMFSLDDDLPTSPPSATAVTPSDAVVLPPSPPNHHSHIPDSFAYASSSATTTPLHVVNTKIPKVLSFSDAKSSSLSDSAIGSSSSQADDGEDTYIVGDCTTTAATSAADVVGFILPDIDEIQPLSLFSSSSSRRRLRPRRARLYSAPDAFFMNQSDWFGIMDVNQEEEDSDETVQNTCTSLFASSSTAVDGKALSLSTLHQHQTLFFTAKASRKSSREARLLSRRHRSRSVDVKTMFGWKTSGQGSEDGDVSRGVEVSSSLLTTKSVAKAATLEANRMTISTSAYSDIPSMASQLSSVLPLTACTMTGGALTTPPATIVPHYHHHHHDNILPIVGISVESQPTSPSLLIQQEQHQHDHLQSQIESSTTITTTKTKFHLFASSASQFLKKALSSLVPSTSTSTTTTTKTSLPIAAKYPAVPLSTSGLRNVKLHSGGGHGRQAQLGQWDSFTDLYSM